MSFVLPKFSSPDKNNSLAQTVHKREQQAKKSQNLKVSDVLKEEELTSLKNSEPITKNPDIIENEFILNFENPADLAEFMAKADRFGVQILDKMSKWGSIRVKAGDLDRFHELIRQDPKPEEFSPNFYVRTPEIPQFGDDSRNPEKVNHLAFEGNTLDWLGLENRLEFRGEGILVAVLDTKVLDHKTFVEGSVEHISMIEGSDSKGSEPYGHGTAIASLINGNSEVAGVVPDAKVLSVEVLNNQGEGDTFTLANGIVEAVNRGADIINMSLGSYGDSFELRRAIDYALDHDVVLVASSGNDGSEGIMYPANYDGVLAVSGVDPLEQHAYFSNHSQNVDIAAPATGIHAAWEEDSFIHFSGTSPAAALVSGAIAGVLSDDPSLTAEEVVNIIVENSNDTGLPGKDPLFGEGIISVGRVQNRDQKGIHDIALSSHYFDPADSEEETVPILISAENRGTESLDTIILDTTIGNQNETLQFTNVEVGETVTGTFYIQKEKILDSEKFQIDSSVSILDQEDSDHENNSKSSILIVKEPVSEEPLN